MNAPLPPERRLRAVEVDCGGGVRAALVHYAPRVEQPRHRHDYAQISFLLGGSMRERLDGREHALFGAATGYKPPGAWHADAWGEAGALIFSLRVASVPDDLLAYLRRVGWATHARCTALAGIVHACLTEDDALRRFEAACDALALAAAPAPGARVDARAPAWLERAREAIVAAQDAVTIEALARDAGVHRVHLSRWFVRHYGIAPSALRRRVAAARAIDAVVRSRRSLTAIAHDGGYADLAHMTRALRADVGMPPSRLRTLLDA